MSGAEVDLIVEGRFGNIPFKIKHQQNTSLGKIGEIRDFVRGHDPPFGVVVDNGESVRWLDESIASRTADTDRPFFSLNLSIYKLCA